MYPSFQNQQQMQSYPQSSQVVTTTSNQRSSWLIGFGAAEIIVSKMFFIWCIWVAATDSAIVVTYFGFVCAAFHFIIGVLAVFGGRDSLRYRRCVVALLVTSVIGSSLFVSLTLAPLIINWAQNTYDCNNCGGSYDERCPDICSITSPAIIYAPILIFILIETIVGITLSSISCCRLCACCGCCYAGDASTSPVAFQVFSSQQTPYYHLREDDIQHSIRPQGSAFYTNQQMNVA